MAQHGWKQLLANHTWFRGKGKYPITAYSEFMPPPRLGRKPYGSVDRLLFQEDDPWGWHVTEYEQAAQLNPGLTQIARELVTSLHHLGRGEPAHGISRQKLQDNPYWPEQTLAPASERYLTLAPLALSRTQDDKGRIRWTLFGASEQGPAKGFWRGFYTAPRKEWPAERSLDFVRRLLAAAYGEAAGSPGRPVPGRLSHPAGASQRRRFRTGASKSCPNGPGRYCGSRGRKLGGVKYCSRSSPSHGLPLPIRKAYLAGQLHLLPFPGSLVFWGVRAPTTAWRRNCRWPARSRCCTRPRGTKVRWASACRSRAGCTSRSATGRQPAVRRSPARPDPQHVPAHASLGPRPSRRGRTGGDGRKKIAWPHVLFSTAADDLGLYGKPMARNAQVWTHDYQLLLDGPGAMPRELIAAADRVAGRRAVRLPLLLSADARRPA